MSFLTFFLMHITPGNFFDTLKLNPQVSEATIARYEKIYRLSDPMWAQYVYWLKNVFKGDLGYSFYYNVPVMHVILPRLGNTFLLSIVTLIFTWAIAIPLGIWAALRRDQWKDKALTVFSFACLSIPSFFLAMLLLYAASRWGILPLGGIHSANYEDFNAWQKFLDVGAHLVIPVIVLSLGAIASLQRIMRGNMLGVLGQQYILAARAKGLPEHRVIYGHALKNAINPMITILGYEFSGLLSGVALVEVVVSWPGLGTLMLTAVRAKDVYLVMASMLMGGVLLLLGNLLADILLAWADPRIRYDE